jgi:biofilm PGA synthesis N-glycosyltransferase PgaC
MENIVRLLFDFAFFYPLTMSLIWMIGSVFISCAGSAPARPG